MRSAGRGDGTCPSASRTTAFDQHRLGRLGYGAPRPCVTGWVAAGGSGQSRRPAQEGLTELPSAAPKGRCCSCVLRTWARSGSTGRRTRTRSGEGRLLHRFGWRSAVLLVGVPGDGEVLHVDLAEVPQDVVAVAEQDHVPWTTDALPLVRTAWRASAGVRAPARPAVVAHGRVVRPQLANELHLAPSHLGVRRGVRLPQHLLSDGEVALLLGREVARHWPPSFRMIPKA